MLEYAFNLADAFISIQQALGSIDLLHEAADGLHCALIIGLTQAHFTRCMNICETSWPHSVSAAFLVVYEAQHHSSAGSSPLMYKTALSALMSLLRLADIAMRPPVLLPITMAFCYGGCSLSGTDFVYGIDECITILAKPSLKRHTLLLCRPSPLLGA